MTKQLFIFFSLSYLLSGILGLPLSGLIFSSDNVPKLALLSALGVLGPLITVLLTTWIFTEQEGRKDLLKI